MGTRALALAQTYLLRAVFAWQSAPRPAVVSKTREAITATVGLIVIVAVPALAIFYARKRWRP
jgi:hypothetical protein